MTEYLFSDGWRRKKSEEKDSIAYLLDEASRVEIVSVSNEETSDCPYEDPVEVSELLGYLNSNNGKRDQGGGMWELTWYQKTPEEDVPDLYCTEELVVAQRSVPDPEAGRRIQTDRQQVTGENIREDKEELIQDIEKLTLEFYLPAESGL